MRRSALRWQVPRSVALAAVAVTVSVSLAEAHDFWLEPSTFRPRVGETLDIRLFVGEAFAGEAFVGEAFARDADHLWWFIARGREKVLDVEGLPGADPAGTLRVEEPGGIVIGYRSYTSTIELPAAAFDAYLAEEGLEHIRRRRALEAPGALSVTEIFARNAKTLLWAGEGSDGGFDRRLNLRLELIPERNPFTMPPGEELSIRLLFESRPLAGARISAINRDEPDRPVSACTDSEGRVRLPLARGGTWLVKALHMLPARASEGPDYFSEWASMTFEVATERMHP